MPVVNHTVLHTQIFVKREILCEVFSLQQKGKKKKKGGIQLTSFTSHCISFPAAREIFGLSSCQPRILLSPLLSEGLVLRATPSGLSGYAPTSPNEQTGIWAVHGDQPYWTTFLCHPSPPARGNQRPGCQAWFGEIFSSRLPPPLPAPLPPPGPGSCKGTSRPAK